MNICCANCKHVNNTGSMIITCEHPKRILYNEKNCSIAMQTCKDYHCNSFENKATCWTCHYCDQRMATCNDESKVIHHPLLDVCDIAIRYTDSYCANWRER